MKLVELCASCFLPLSKRWVLMLHSSGLVRVHDRLACRMGRYSGKELHDIKIIGDRAG